MDYEKLKVSFLEEVDNKEYSYFNLLQIDNQKFCESLSIESVDDLISKKHKLYAILYPNLQGGSAFKMIISSFDKFYYNKFNKLNLNFNAIKFNAKSVKSIHNLSASKSETEEIKELRKSNKNLSSEIERLKSSKDESAELKELRTEINQIKASENKDLC